MLTLGARPAHVVRAWFLRTNASPHPMTPARFAGREPGTTRLRAPNTPARTAGRKPEWANAGSPASQAAGGGARRLRAQHYVLTPSHSSVGRVKLSQPVSVRRQPLSQTPSKLRPPCVTRPWPSGPEVLQPPS